MIRRSFFLSIWIFTAIGLWSCGDRDENFITDGSVRLQFSVDTLRFDTVFTALGSATRSFKVFNPNDRPVRVGRVYLEGGNASFFRMNVDGTPGDEVQDVEIWGKDSIYVFVEVTIDPDQPLSVSPYVVEEKVVFETNENRQEVLLEAWGQNANYFPSRFNKGVPVVLSCNGGTLVWDDPKPYVIYGEILIDSCALEVAAGTRIYVHGGIARNDLFGVFNDGIIYTLERGSLRVRGTQDQPVIIQGDRLEEPFQDQAGQWFGIVLGRGSKGNVMEYTTVRNSNIGVFVDSTAELTALNSRFYNTAGNGIVAFRSKVTARNCLFYNNATNSVQLILGGDYLFEHCTVASYGVNASAIGMSNFFCYDQNPLNCSIRRTYRLNATFRNCIFFGSRRDEIELSDYTLREMPVQFSVRFENCVVRVDQLLTSNNGLYANFFDSYCQNCIRGDNTSRLFLDANGDDYHLDSLSIAIDKGVLIPQLALDLEGTPRDDLPDIGCFERQK